MRAYAVLVVAVLAVSSSAIVVRVLQAEGVASLAIAAWRLSIASVLLGMWMAANPAPRAEFRAMSSRTRWLCLGSGVFLAAHFGTWISSLAFTSVASSAVLVATTPIWIALFSWLALKESPRRGVLIGIVVAIAGSVVLIRADAVSSAASAGSLAASNALLGNALALMGALTVCGYLLIGRSVRATVSLVPYIFCVYSVAAIALWIAALVAGVASVQFSLLAWAALAWLAIGPQLIGHSSFNWALKRFSASFVAVVTLAEPIGAAVLAWLFLDEQFAPAQFVGFSILLVGIFIAARAEAAAEPTKAEE